VLDQRVHAAGERRCGGVVAGVKVISNSRASRRRHGTPIDLGVGEQAREVVARSARDPR